MKQPLNTQQNFSSSDKIKILVVSIFLAILLVIFGILLGTLLRQSGFRLPILLARLQAKPTLAPAAMVPTLDCGISTLVIGSTTYQIQTLSPAPDGSLTVPPDTSGIAYWVEGTNSNYVFLLSPTAENLVTMSTISAGSLATANWSNCITTTYTLAASEQSSLNASALPDQSQEGITIFFQTDPSGTSFMFKGGLAAEDVDVIDTPRADESGILAEISLLETIRSADGATIRISLSIRNYGQAVFTVSTDNISLTQPDGRTLALAESKPRLPEEIKPGQTKTFEFTFPRPVSPTTTLKIFTAEYDVEGY
jgi:flagellar biogenesis protein FliO